MYKVIQNSQHLAKWMKALPQQLRVLDRNELIRRRLEQSVQCMDESYGSERNLEKDLGGFIIILYGSSWEIEEHCRKIMEYFHLDKTEYEYEDSYSEPERTTTVTFRLYLCSSDYGIEIVTIKSQPKSLESRLKEGDCWQEGNECLTLCDITKPPLYFEGDIQQWIEELTAYEYSYPNQWRELYEEYLCKAEKAGNHEKTVLGFHRSEDGYLRKDGERDVYLKVEGVEALSMDILEQIGSTLSKQADEMLQSYLEYCAMDEQKRNSWKKLIKDKISSWVPGKEVIVEFTEALDESAFAGNELYYDMLNRLYIIL